MTERFASFMMTGLDAKRPRRRPGPFFALRNADGLADGAAEIGAAMRHRQHDRLGSDVDPRIEIADVLVGEAEAAGGNAGADRLRRVGAVDAIDGDRKSV